jgi:hypothetical protein
MSFDLGVWAVPVPPEDDGASAARYRDLCASDEPSRRPQNPAVVAFVRDLAERYPDGEPWSTEPFTTDDAVVLTIVWSRADEVSAVVRAAARRRGLVCHDPQTGVTDRPGSGSPSLSSCDGVRGVPAAAVVVDRELRRLSRRNWFVIVERAADRWVQVGYGAEAGTRPGWYALEWRTADGHLRTEIPDLREIVVAVQAFVADDPDWSRRFAWNPVRSG